MCLCSNRLAARLLTTSVKVRNKFNVDEIAFEPRAMREQRALFYAAAVPLKILSITAPAHR